MSSLRNILQKCGRNASILGGTPLQIQCASTSNPAYYDSICISRQSYSSDANEAPKNANDIVQKYILEMMNAKKSRSKLVEDQKEPKSFTADSAQKAFCAGKLFKQMNAKTPIFYKNSNKWPRDIAAAQKASNSSTFHKNFNPCRYYITVRELSNETTPDSLREFYSQFGEIAVSKIEFEGKPHQFGKIAFLSQEAMNHALYTLPHCIDGKETKNVLPATLDRMQRTLEVTNLSPRTTTESLKAFYSKYGSLDDCKIKKATAEIGRIGKVRFADRKYALNALNSRPHTIEGVVVDLRIASKAGTSLSRKGKSVGTDENIMRLKIKDVPEGITEETLRAFYSKYGQVRECRLSKRDTGKTLAFVLFSAVDEVNRAVDDRPHIINGNLLRVSLRDRTINVSLFVGSLPENIANETLHEEFSKYGKLVYWELRNDGKFNQSGPYGFVTYSSEQEALNALNSGPHTVEGAVVDVRKASEAGKSLSKEKSYD